MKETLSKIDADRYDRLEVRVDQIRDDVSELRADAKFKTQLMEDLKQELKDHTVAVKEHVLGDNKVIDKLEPILDSFQEIRGMVDDYKFKKEQSKRRTDALKYWSVRLGLVATIIGIAVGIGEFLNFL